MNEIIIPPAPSWYMSNILAVNEDGSLLAYGTKHELVVFKVTSTPEACDILKFFIPLAHKDKINALAFSPSNSGSLENHLVSCSDDGTVKVWDYETESLIFSHSGHPEGQKLPGVDWSRADPNLIVSISDLGSLVCWDLISNTIRRLFTGSKILPVCLSCCPHNKDLIGIGAKSGLVVIYNIKGDGHIVFRIRGHECDVVSLAWCPVPYNIFRNHQREHALLLASGSKDKGIYFWRAGTDGRFETCVNLPSQPLATSGYRNKNGVGGPGNSWVCVRWCDPYTLLTSSQFGELLALDLLTLRNIDKNSENILKKPKQIKMFKLIHGNHSKGLFSIAIPTRTSSDLEDDRIVWTSALDKHLVACRLSSCKIVIDITAIGGIVYCMAISPLDPNRLALGMGDNKVFVWNMSNGSYDDVTTFWNKVNSKVMAVCWHPTRESILAFSTGEGRIGVLDVTSNSKPPTLLRLHHRRSVYNIIWAPPVIETINSTKPKKWDLALFSVGDGEILQYDMDNPDKEPVDLGPIIKKCDTTGKTLGRTDLSWNHDKTVAAVGNENGVVYIVDGKTLAHQHTIYAHKKLVQCLMWHPSTVTTESEVSPYASWLASAADVIQVHNVTSECTEVVAKLDLHSEKIVSLAWSPHFNGRLVSASYDYTCQVWDVPSGTSIACFDSHHNSVLCCLPSPLHPDIFITGSADSTVRVWNMKKYSASQKPKNKKLRLSGTLKKFAQAREASDLTAPNGAEFIRPSVPEKTEAKLKTDIADGPAKRKNKSMFPVTYSSLSATKHIGVLWSRINGEEILEPPSVNEITYLDFFGDSKAMKRLLMVEETHHRDTGNLTYAQHMSLWTGDISEAIKDACRKKKLTDWIISLAPMVSHQLWMDCCLSYADQLSECGDALKASSYYLAVHRVEDAVNALINGKLFREAVSLAKSRFPPDDPTVIKALLAWGHSCIGTGSFSISSHCFLAAGKTADAVDLLSRCKDADSLSLASRIAGKIEATDLSVNLVVRSLETSLIAQDFVKARETLEHHSSLKDLKVWLEVCQLIGEKKHLSSDNAIDWICGKGIDEPGLFEEALAFCKDIEPNELLGSNIPVKLSQESSKKVLLRIGAHVALSVIAFSTDSKSNDALRHMIDALNAAYGCIFANPVNTEVYMELTARLSPKGPLCGFKLIDDQENEMVESIKMFLSCGAIYWLAHLQSQLLLPIETSALQSMLLVIKSTALMIFKKDIMKFFKNAVEIKKLENSIVAAKLNVPPTIKYCTDLEAELCNKTDSEKPDENCLNNGLANGHKDQENQIAENHLKENTNEQMQLLAEIKNFNKKFEEERVSTPNPCVIYCVIKNLIQCHFIKAEKESGEVALKELSLLWDTLASED